jgi:hypothetical protein
MEKIGIDFLNTVTFGRFGYRNGVQEPDVVDAE